MEGGLLLIIAGITEDEKEICIMKMISPSKITEFDSEFVIKDKDQNTLLSFDFINDTEIKIYINVNNNLFDLTIQRNVPPLKLQTGDDILGGFDWNVHNLFPSGKIQGNISLNEYTNPIVLQNENTSTYFEHSYGNIPLIFLGWDFFYTSNPNKNSYIILQHYFGNQKLSYIDIFFNEKHLHVPFYSDHVKIKYSYEFNHILHKKVPKIRSITINYEGYQIDICYLVIKGIPLLRNDSFIIRNFFIYEEFSRCSYFIRDESGKILVNEKDLFAGGETAYFSFPYKNIFVGFVVVFVFCLFFTKVQIFPLTW